MPLDFFDNMIRNDVIQQPCKYYHDLQQAFINDQWDNSTAVKIVQEQDMDEQNTFSKFKFHEIEAWTNYVVGQTSTTKKNGDDFAQLTFKCLEHPCVRGRYYKFDDNYWLSDFTDEYDSIVKTLTVRRCNNKLRIVDPENGSIFSIPCIVDYNMMAPNAQISRSVITPNNHATVICQANSDTLRLFKLNTRFILGGRPFKLFAYQNAMLDDEENSNPTLFYLELFLDEIHAKDDLQNQIAFNGDWNYKIVIPNGDMELSTSSKGKINANVILNGKEIERSIKWVSDDTSIIYVNADGTFKTKNKIGEANITAYMKDNLNINTTIKVNVTKEITSNSYIRLSPSFDKIREGEKISVKVIVVHEGQDIDNADIAISLSKNEPVLSNDYIQIEPLSDNMYDIICTNRSQVPMTIYIMAIIDDTIIIRNEVNIDLVNIFG